jgi:phage portal protein BeeE
MNFGALMFDRLKNLLRAPETKTSRVAQLLALQSSGRACWTPRDYAALAREGYVQNAIVHRAVRLIAENAAACAYIAVEDGVGRDTHPLLDLMARPNPRQDGAGLFEALYAHLLIAGNAYIEAVAIDSQVRELYVLRPDRMRVVPGPDGWAEAYDYCVGGATVRFDQNAPLPPILHLTFFHPLDDHYGLAPLEAAAVAVDSTVPHVTGWQHLGIPGVPAPYDEYEREFILFFIVAKPVDSLIGGVGAALTMWLQGKK